MNTDVAISYKAKLIEIDNKIREIEKIGFDVTKIKEELDSIKIENNNDIKSSKKNSFEGLIEIDYINATGKLEKLDAKLDSYTIYVKAYFYVKYLNKVNISVENINEIIDEIKLLLRKIRNSSVVDYEDEKQVVEPFYKAILKVIFIEIKLKQKSELLEYCKNDNNDTMFISLMIEEYIKTIDLTEYPEIEVCYYNAKKNLNPAELLDNSFIKTIVFRDEKEKLEESIKDDMTNLLSLIDKSDSQIYHTYSSYTNADQDVQYYKKLCKKSLLKLFTSLISTAITLSISIGIFSGVFSWFKELTSAYYYETNTEIYNSITNQVTSSNAKEIIGFGDEIKPEQTYLIEYHVLDDKTAKKEGRKSREYNYGAAEAKLKLRETKTYDLSFLGYDDIEKYIEYIQSNNLLPESKKNIIDISKSPIKYTELVDYYEIIYKTIDLESKEFESTDTTLNVAMGLLLSGLFTLIFHRLAKIDLSYFKDKKFLKRDKKEFLEYSKILLNEIGKNEELRQQFNIEMSKHKDIFIKYGLELPKEVVDSNIKKKLM